MYRAVTGSFTVPSVVTVAEFMVQVTMVAGPAVEIHVRVSWSELYKIVSSSIKVNCFYHSSGYKLNCERWLY